MHLPPTFLLKRSIIITDILTKHYGYGGDYNNNNMFYPKLQSLLCCSLFYAISGNEIKMII